MLLVGKLAVFARRVAFGINRIGGFEHSVVTLHRPDKGGANFSRIHEEEMIDSRLRNNDALERA